MRPLLSRHHLTFVRHRPYLHELRFLLLAAPSKPPLSTLQPTSKMPGEFGRCMVFERRIAREALLDAVLGEYSEPLSFARRSSATEDAPRAADNEDVPDGEIPPSHIRKLSLEFDSEELSDILAAANAPPPPLRRTRLGPSSPTGGPGCPRPVNAHAVHAEQQEIGPPEAHCAWGALAKRFKLSLPASPSHTPAKEECAPSATSSPLASCVRATSSISTDARVAGTLHPRQSMHAQGQDSFCDLHLSVGEDQIFDEDDASFLL